MQIVRSTKPVITFCVAVFFEQEKWSVLGFLAVLGVCGSITLMSVGGDVALSGAGMTCVGLGAIADIMRVVVLKALLTSPKLDPCSAIGVLQPMGLFFLSVPMFMVEWNADMVTESARVCSYYSSKQVL